MQSGFVVQDMRQGDGQRVGAAVGEVVHITWAVEIVSAWAPVFLNPSERGIVSFFELLPLIIGQLGPIEIEVRLDQGFHIGFDIGFHAGPGMGLAIGRQILGNEALPRFFLTL